MGTGETLTVTAGRVDLSLWGWVIAVTISLIATQGSGLLGHYYGEKSSVLYDRQTILAVIPSPPPVGSVALDSSLPPMTSLCHDSPVTVPSGIKIF